LTTHSQNYALTHQRSLTNSLAYSSIHSQTRSLIHNTQLCSYSPTHSQTN